MTSDFSEEGNCEMKQRKKQGHKPVQGRKAVYSSTLPSYVFDEQMNQVTIARGVASFHNLMLCRSNNLSG